MRIEIRTKEEKVIEDLLRMGENKLEYLMSEVVCSDGLKYQMFISIRKKENSK